MEPSPPILHVDMDAFFASVELLERPDLKGKPVIVGGRSARAVVTSATYEARAYGVHSAMPVGAALRLCPKAIVLEPHMERYRDASRRVMALFREVTPLVEPLSIDEAFLDVAGARRLLGESDVIATALRARVLAETGLTCSVGVAPTKYMAKLASGRAKPDGMLVIRPSEVLAYLHPLPVRALWGVGGKTAEHLERYGLMTVGELAAAPLGTVVAAVGEAAGTRLHELANGIDPREVVTTSQEKSVGHERTFDVDERSPEVLRRELLHQSNRVAARLRAAGLVGKTVALKLRFSDFTTISRSRTLAEHTDLGKRIYDEVSSVLEAAWKDGAPVRLIGVRVEQLTEAGETLHQPSLWADETVPSEGWHDAERTIDKVAARFGTDIVRPASLMRSPASGETAERNGTRR
ncbi:DNA polymerase IV [Herbiconiux sp. KACC 21604]|uniref:DNA polymerase IV n=1 Tax=unclassified Herbiconiux TaxID=2618217 RepID=UPI001492BD2B|nr:DNA polymerase IV [Herbiconiux sp. SALV-R1]QJU52899.1 DNA polymerase IV [Herbiconiux sp. SALV-R1]WPO87819.1 DNA polymerase IV [Herbiconiux sp. KACC 21604]